MITNLPITTMFADVEFLLHQISTNIATNYQANASPTYQNQKTNKQKTRSRLLSRTESLHCYWITNNYINSPAQSKHSSKVPWLQDGTLRITLMYQYFTTGPGEKGWVSSLNALTKNIQITDACHINKAPEIPVIWDTKIDLLKWKLLHFAFPWMVGE